MNTLLDGHQSITMAAHRAAVLDSHQSDSARSSLTPSDDAKPTHALAHWFFQFRWSQAMPPATFKHAAALCAGLALSPIVLADCKDFGSRERFGAHGDNSILYNRMNNRGWAERDEAALRAHFSFKYSILGCPVPPVSGSHALHAASSKELEAFISYTGMFDFYMGTRESGPVINRISNPGFHLRVPLRRWLEDADPHSSLEFSLEHRSDGQVFEPDTDTGRPRLEQAYERRERQLFDTISRGSNFLGVQASWIAPLGGSSRVDLRAKVHLYTSKDSAVNWGPLAGTGVSIADYDMLNLRAGYQHSSWGRWELSWRLGKRGLKADSFELSWQAPDKLVFDLSLPLYVLIHRGPMNTLSNYTQAQDSIGIGLRFDRF